MIAIAVNGFNESGHDCRDLSDILNATSCRVHIVNAVRISYKSNGNNSPKCHKPLKVELGSKYDCDL